MSSDEFLIFIPRRWDDSNDLGFPEPSRTSRAIELRQPCRSSESAFPSPVLARAFTPPSVVAAAVMVL